MGARKVKNIELRSKKTKAADFRLFPRRPLPGSNADHVSAGSYLEIMPQIVRVVSSVWQSKVLLAKMKGSGELKQGPSSLRGWFLRFPSTGIRFRYSYRHPAGTSQVLHSPPLLVAKNILENSGLGDRSPMKPLPNGIASHHELRTNVRRASLAQHAEESQLESPLDYQSHGSRRESESSH